MAKNGIREERKFHWMQKEPMEKSYRCSGACVYLYGVLIPGVQMLQD